MACPRDPTPNPAGRGLVAGGSHRQRMVRFLVMRALTLDPDPPHKYLEHKVF